MILHQVESLAAAGVTDIVLAVNYRPDIMEKALKEVSLSRLLKDSCGKLFNLINTVVRREIQC